MLPALEITSPRGATARIFFRGLRTVWAPEVSAHRLRCGCGEQCGCRSLRCGEQWGCHSLWRGQQNGAAPAMRQGLWAGLCPTINGLPKSPLRRAKGLPQSTPRPAEWGCPCDAARALSRPPHGQLPKSSPRSRQNCWYTVWVMPNFSFSSPCHWPYRSL